MTPVIFFLQCIARCQGKDKGSAPTVGAVMQAVLAIDNAEDARTFYWGYVGYLCTQAPHPQYTPEEIVASNIGWCLGEGMSRERIRMWEQMGVMHPVLGSLEGLSAEQIFARGMAFGKALRTGDRTGGHLA
jgi:hypothetical protein